MAVPAASRLVLGQKKRWRHATDTSAQSTFRLNIGKPRAAIPNCGPLPIKEGHPLPLHRGLRSSEGEEWLGLERPVDRTASQRIAANQVRLALIADPARLPLFIRANYRRWSVKVLPIRAIPTGTRNIRSNSTRCMRSRSRSGKSFNKNKTGSTSRWRAGIPANHKDNNWSSDTNSKPSSSSNDTYNNSRVSTNINTPDRARTGPLHGDFAIFVERERTRAGQPAIPNRDQNLSDPPTTSKQLECLFTSCVPDYAFRISPLRYLPVFSIFDWLQRTSSIAGCE